MKSHYFEINSPTWPQKHKFLEPKPMLKTNVRRKDKDGDEI